MRTLDFPLVNGTGTGKDGVNTVTDRLSRPIYGFIHCFVRQNAKRLEHPRLVLERSINQKINIASKPRITGFDHGKTSDDKVTSANAVEFTANPG